MTSKPSDKDLEWIEEQEKLTVEGSEILRKAHNEALEYMTDAVEHINDKAWRKMVVSTQAIEMGIGIAMVEHLVPDIYGDMEKKLHKKLNLPKETARALRHIYIGRVMKNVRKELNDRL